MTLSRQGGVHIYRNYTKDIYSQDVKDIRFFIEYETLHYHQ